MKSKEEEELVPLKIAEKDLDAFANFSLALAARTTSPVRKSSSDEEAVDIQNEQERSPVSKQRRK